MGFNFVTGHPDNVLEDDGQTGQMLIDRFGTSVPLGIHGDPCCIEDEIAWSWWGKLQKFAANTLGKSASKQIRAIDASYGVYIDAVVERELLWPPGMSPPSVAVRWMLRVRHAVGVAQASLRQNESDKGIRAAIADLVRQCGPRPGEYHALQVGSLRGLMGELESLLRVLNVKATPDAVETLRQYYVSSDERCETDGHIQSLCHAWLTANRAIRIGAPLWLVK